MAMSAISLACRKLLDPLLNAQSTRERWIYIFTLLLHVGFYVYILFSALGKAPRYIGSLVSLTGLLGYYALDYNNSNLKRLGALKWIYFIFLAYLLFKVFHNIHISNGWYGFKTNIHQGFALLFIGLEIVKNHKDIVRLIVLFCIAGFYQGLDGIYQWFTGVDFINGYEVNRWHGGVRLTGSMKTPRIGNYLSLVVPMAMGFWWVLPQHWSRLTRFGMLVLLFFPPIFLLIGSQTRSGILGAFCAVLIFFILFQGFSWKQLILASGVAIWALFWGFKRTAWETLMQDPRFSEVWPHALAVFKSAPILGVGLNSYNPGVHSLGLEFVRESSFLQHPHNIYLQFLCEMGIVGLIILLVFYGSYLMWSLDKIKHGLKNSAKNKAWIMAACFWASFLGYMVTAISGHDFFRTWWLGLALSILGVVMGSCLTLIKQHKN